jgi:hypothetical protein
MSIKYLGVLKERGEFYLYEDLFGKSEEEKKKKD